MVNVLEGLNVDVLGVNCSLGPIELTPIINDILKTATVPVMIQPNAGLPCLVEGKTCYNMDKETFVNESLKHVINGVSIIGGCCGTTPEFIAALKKNLPSKKIKLTPINATRVSSGTKTVEFDQIGPKEQLTPKTSTFKPSKTLTIVIGSHPDNVLKLLSYVIVTKIGRLLFSLAAKTPAFTS